MEGIKKSKKKNRKSGEGCIKSYNKLRRSQGVQYIGNNNKIVKAKIEPTATVDCKCKYKCGDIPHEQKVTLFREFYSLGDNVKQNSYLMGLLTVCPVKRRRHGSYEVPTESRRQSTICFTLPNGSGDVVQVCKKTFLHSFAISKRRVETLVKIKKEGKFTYVKSRGNKSKYRKFSPADEDLVMQHISSFPREQSHYSRQKSEKEYLSQDLNINRLYYAFKEVHPNSAVTYRFYFNVFKKKFPKLSFHHPRTDTCKTCDLLNIKITTNPNDKDSKNKRELHHRQAEKAIKTIKEDHCLSQLPLSDTCSISIDLEQVLSLPALTHGQMFYLRQLSCYNFGVHVGDTNKGLMHLWHEGITGRGGNEIASCILKTVLSGFTNKHKMVIWSDNCIGQNKNKMLLFLWIYLVQKGYFHEINQKFLLSGHSFLSCDRDFAHIEKRKRVEKCEVPFDLVRLIATATPNNPFIVTLMQPEDFFDFKAAADLTLNTAKIKISTAKWIQVSAENPKQIKIRTILNEMEEWKYVNIFKKNINEQSIRNMDIPQLNCQNQIKENKKADLRAILPFLKPENRSFYKNLLI